MNKTLIITGGCLSKDFLQQVVKEATFDYVIAVDGALAYVEEAGVPIHCIVGDFDTICPEILKHYMKNDELYIERHRPEKDETDTELAMQIAMNRGSEEIVILGATGGRLDHFLGNLHLLLQPLKRNISCFILDEQNRICLIDKKKQFAEQEQFGTYISFLPFTDEVTDVCLTGFKYPFVHGNMKKGNTLGISNERIAPIAEVQIGTGILMCIESRDRKRK